MTCQVPGCGQPATHRLLYFEVPVCSHLCEQHAAELDAAHRAGAHGVPAGKLVKLEPECPICGLRGVHGCMGPKAKLPACKCTHPALAHNGDGDRCMNVGCECERYEAVKLEDAGCE